MMFNAFLLMAAMAAHSGARPASAPADACHLLTKTEVAAVQGAAFVDSKMTSRGPTTQCFYRLPAFVNSVSVDVTRKGGRAFWRDHFEAESAGREHEAESEERENAERVHDVRGVGDEAVWTSSRAAGSLYVRKGDAVLRISVGGPGSEEQKLEKSKKLAKSALRRM